MDPKKSINLGKTCHVPLSLSLSLKFPYSLRLMVVIINIS